jgi:hypothetical protein
MKTHILFLVLLLTFFQSIAQNDKTKPDPNFGSNPAGGQGPVEGDDTTGDDETDDEEEDGDEEEATKNNSVEGSLNALLQYNFSSGNNAIGSLTPVVDFGFTRSLVKKGKTFNWDLSINPYAAGQIDIKDSTSFVPALMLPGVAGVRINQVFRFKVKKVEFALMPANFGIKVMSNFSDSSSAIFQHNIRSAFGFKFDDLFIIGIQHTWGWHNLTSQSEEIYQEIFKRNSTDISYFVITLQSQIPKKENSYFFAEWRGVTDVHRFKDYQNTKIISFGVRIGMSFENIAPASGGNNNRKENRTQKQSIWNTQF